MKRINKIFCVTVWVVLFCAVLSAATAQTQMSVYFTGSGGKGISLGIGTPESQGLNTEQGYLPTMVQGVLVADLSKYSAISVLDREALDRVINETLDPTFEDNLDIVRLGHVAQVGSWLTGKIIKTSTGYSLQINITDTSPEAKTMASYSGTCTVEQFDDYSAIHQASSALLEQMGVALTQKAKNELNHASTRQYVNSQTALSQGITAQKQGTEIAALTYYYQAAAYDPSLLEAASRVSILTANISSGNIGDDARNDIQWRKDWQTRLDEANTFFTNYIANSQPYCEIVYSTNMEAGKVNYSDETMPFTFPVRLFVNGSAYFTSLEKAVQDVTNGLAATRRNGEWNLRWPGNFAGRRTIPYDVDFELVNSNGTVIGARRVRLDFNWRISGGNKIEVSQSSPGTEQVTIVVKANDITDTMTIRVKAVNGKVPQSVNVSIIPINEVPPPDNDFQFDHFTGELYGGSSRVTSIPATIWGVPVTSIRSRAFENKGLTSITIPHSVKSIGSYAFANNKLISVFIPGSSVTSIGDYAFANNKLTTLYIHDSVISIGDGAYSRNPLTTVRIPNGVKIGKEAIMMQYSSVFSKNSKGIDGPTRLPGFSITIGEGVNLSGDSFYTDNSEGVYYSQGHGSYTYDFTMWADSLFQFRNFYNSNNKKAGKYTYTRKIIGLSRREYQWFYEP